MVTWMEVLAGARGADEEDVIDLFLRDFTVVALTRPVARAAVALTRSSGRRRRPSRRSS
jgi:predicted nucleic acid-binding protein